MRTGFLVVLTFTATTTVPDTKEATDKYLLNASMSSLNSYQLTAEAMCTAEDQDSEESRSNNKFCVPTKN